MKILDQADEDLFVFVAQRNDPCLDAFWIVPRRHHKERLVCPAQIEQAGRMGDASRLNALPGGDVQIDGQAVGTTPLGHVRLSIGPHRVVFRHPELGEQTRTAVISVGNETRLVVDLRK